MQTHEQTVVKAQQEIAALKKTYMQAVKTILDLKSTDALTVDHILECQQKGNAYFNYVENFTANSGLLGAHKNGNWATTWAETCYATLEVVPNHFSLLRSYKEKFNLGKAIEASPTAYGSMQRMVKHYLPEEDSSQLREQFKNKKLPINGFDKKAAKDTDMETKLDELRKYSAWLSICSFLIVIIFSLACPSPTKWQQLVFRTLLSFGGAGVCSLLPGFFNIEVKVSTYATIFATGAVGTFVLIWLVNPPFI